MSHRTYRRILALAAAFGSPLKAETPPLLAKALARWTEGSEDLAFTQLTRRFQWDGNLMESRVERYDPSLPDPNRWRLLEVNGIPATPEQRATWEQRKNARTRKVVAKSPYTYLDLDHATLASRTTTSTRFAIGLRPETARLLALENISILVTVDNQTASIVSIAATLREPIRVLLGLARITDLDVDVRVEPADESSTTDSGAVMPGSTASVKISKLGRPIQYDWSDFKRVASYSGPHVTS